MDIKEYQKIMKRNEDLNKETELVELGLRLFSNSGKISGNIQEIVYNDEFNKKKVNADKLKENIKENIDIIITMCNVINVDLDTLISNSLK